MPADQPGLLHRRGEYGYTDKLTRSVFAEPEAVSADEQRRQTDAAQLAAHDAQMREWQDRRAAIQREANWL